MTPPERAPDEIAETLTETERTIIRDAPRFCDPDELWKLHGLGLLSSPGQGFVGYYPLGLAVRQHLMEQPR